MPEKTYYITIEDTGLPPAPSADTIDIGLPASVNPRSKNRPSDVELLGKAIRRTLLNAQPDCIVNIYSTRTELLAALTEAKNSEDPSIKSVIYAPGNGTVSRDAEGFMHETLRAGADDVAILVDGEDSNLGVTLSKPFESHTTERRSGPFVIINKLAIPSSPFMRGEKAYNPGGDDEKQE